jgi:hypothetical protein
LADPAAEMRHQHGRRRLEAITSRALECGEISAAAVTILRFAAGTGMLRYQFSSAELPIPDAVIVGMADDTVIPLLVGL